MSDQDSLHGLNCPNCGGMVPIPEGQMIVICPFCELRSIVQGERGLHRYQAPLRIDRAHAVDALHGFLRRRQQIARDALTRSRLTEAFVAYVPFWTSWARVLGWVFGEERVGSGKDTRYKPREVQFAQDAIWNGAACDIGEFGVETVPLGEEPLESFNPEALHERGLVFEPVGLLSEARAAAEKDFHDRVEKSSRLDRISQTITRLVHRRLGLVYYPLWVLRYLYRGRAFQVVVDGRTGQVLYGKAPGNSLFRAAVLVGGMALGALIAIDGSSLAFYLGSQTDDDCTIFVGVAIGALVLGFGMMYRAYRSFRYGEQYEYRQSRKAASLFDIQDLMSQAGELTSWINPSD